DQESGVLPIGRPPIRGVRLGSAGEAPGRNKKKIAAGSRGSGQPRFYSSNLIGIAHAVNRARAARVYIFAGVTGWRRCASKAAARRAYRLLSAREAHRSRI